MEKKLIVTRGISGSGKTSLALELASLYGGVAYCADDFFMEDGEYKWSEEKLGAAHKWCFDMVEAAIKNPEIPVIIVHNVNDRNKEISEWEFLAKKYNIKFISLVVEKRHNGKNVHGVSDEKLLKQAETLKQNIQLIPTPKTNKDGLEIIKFLKKYKDNNDLDTGLKILETIYFINHKKLNGKLLLKYFTFSDKTLTMVQECRGLILSEETLEIVSLPLEKFFNLGESSAANHIVEGEFKCLEKCDGTFCSLYYDQINSMWCVQTNGQIEAEETVKDWGKDGEFSFKWSNLFWDTFEKYSSREILDKLDKDWTYMFELCTPYNKVVVTHPESRLIFLALRNKKTLKEDWPKNCILNDVFERPKLYGYKNIHDILSIAKNELTKEDEGFILLKQSPITGDFERVKVKSSAYIEEHYKSTVITLNSVCHVIFQHEEDEWLLTFPEYKEVVNKIKEELELEGAKIDEAYHNCLKEFLSINNGTKKEFSEIVFRLYSKNTDGIIPYVFNLFDKKHNSGKECIMHYMTNEQLIYKVYLFIKRSNISNKIEFNANNKSLKG